MISREEAEKLMWNSPQFREEYKVGISLVLDKLYDSVGSCSECEHWETDIGLGDYRKCNLSIYKKDIAHREDWYCADFKRKEV